MARRACALSGGHNDTIYGAPGGNDNASGTIPAMLETARVLAGLCRETSIRPGRTIRFCTFSAEEQKFQGAYAYIDRRYRAGPSPRLVINLDELSTDHIKGVVLACPNLHDFVQGHLDDMGDGLECHVMSQLDATSDHFPFLGAAFDTAHLWGWHAYCCGSRTHHCRVSPATPKPPAASPNASPTNTVPSFASCDTPH